MQQTVKQCQSLADCLAMAPNALFSSDRVYRYALTRRWSAEGGWCGFIGLNPSTADESENDPTIRRCISFARSWGFGGLVMLNLHGIRSADPRVLLTVALDIDGPDNRSVIFQAAKACDRVVACWGTWGRVDNSGTRLAKALIGDGCQLECLGITKDGFPKHPLYLAKTTTLQKFVPAEA